jgi:hypothetical protein
MSAWFRALQDSASQKMHKEATPFCAELDMAIPEVGVVAILADAILKSTRTADYRR